VEDIFPAEQLRAATVLEARTLANAVAIADSSGAFALRPLPVEAQLAPVHAAAADDFDGDGRVDLLLAGNFYGVPPIQGRYDASYGTLLRGAGDGRFTAVDRRASGLLIEGEARDVKSVRTATGARMLVVARSGAALQFLRPTRLAADSAARVAAR
jgi:hypothetical protein